MKKFQTVIEVRSVLGDDNGRVTRSARFGVDFVFRTFNQPEGTLLRLYQLKRLRDEIGPDDYERLRRPK